MPGIGVAVNIVAVLAGTAIGLVFGRLISERFRAIAYSGIGLAVIVIGVAMALGGLGDLGATAIGDYSALVLVGALVVGSITGEAMRIEHYLERFGLWLQEKAYRAPMLAPGKVDQPGEKGHTLVEGFVAASLLFCVGAMTVLGSLQDGLGDPSLLYLKALLDGIASMALATTLGAGVGLSVIPILLIQGGIVLAATGVEPYITPAVVASIEAVGGALILAIGLDLAQIKRLPVGNMLPSVFLAAFLALILV
jgi:uncharacterized membrane protein YqgA involved in biofilm formation